MAPPCEAAASNDDEEMFTETATGWHVFKVVGYSHLNGFGTDRSVQSSTFAVGGHTWCVKYFPDGVNSSDAADWVCFSLGLERRAAAAARRGDAVVARARFSLLDDDLPLLAPPPPAAPATLDTVLTFRRGGEAWCFKRFMARRQFESAHVKDDTFRVRCDLAVLEKAAGCSSPPPPPLPGLLLRRQLGELLASGDGADVTLEVGEELFRAHKNVLAARSPVFRAAFFGGPLKERDAARVRIDGVEPGVFEALLRFIYTEALPDENDGDDRLAMAQHLLAAADRYGIEKLKSICEYVLCTVVDESAVVTTLVLAEQHGCHQLKEACFRVLRSSANYEELVERDDFQHLARTFSSLLQELPLHGLKSSKTWA